MHHMVAVRLARRSADEGLNLVQGVDAVCPTDVVGGNVACVEGCACHPLRLAMRAEVPRVAWDEVQSVGGRNTKPLSPRRVTRQGPSEREVLVRGLDLQVCQRRSSVWVPSQAPQAWRQGVARRIHGRCRCHESGDESLSRRTTLVPTRREESAERPLRP